MPLKRVAIAAYLIVLHVVVGIACVKTDLLSRAAVRLGLTEPAPIDSEPFIAAWRTFHETMDAEVPTGATIFLGDSITRAMPVKDVAPLAVNYGIGWQRSDQLIESMDIYASLHRASRIVVMIGTNDLLQSRDEGIEARYQAILSKLPAGIPVTMVGVPPLAPTATALRGKVDDARVRAVVAGAQRACSAHPACRFVSAYDALGEQGVARAGVLQEDGIHLAPHGYVLLTGLIRQSLAAQK